MNDHRDEDAGWIPLLAIFAVGFAVLGGTIGYQVGWDAGVRDAVAGRATVIEKPDGTTEALKVKAKEAQ